MYELPILYKKSTNGTQQWKIVASADGEAAYFEVEHGKVDGKQQVTRTNILKGKNIGKSNETTPYEQACSEALSKWKRKQDKGYVLDTDGKTDKVLPMLAHSYEEYKHQVTFPSWVQVKLDGVRAITVIKNGIAQMFTRGSEEILTMPHLIDFLSPHPDCILDGELYSHEMTFQELISLVKKFDKDNHTKVKYIVYDVIDEDQSFEDRFVKAEIPTGDYVSKLTTHKVESHEEIQELHDKFVENEYEGAILRNGKCPYEKNKKSRGLLKVKDFITEEFEIVGAKENRGKLEGTCVFIMKMSDGQLFDALPEGKQEHKEWLWQNHQSLIGKMATIKYFELTDGGIPRFPIFIAVRDYE